MTLEYFQKHSLTNSDNGIAGWLLAGILPTFPSHIELRTKIWPNLCSKALYQGTLTPCSHFSMPLKKNSIKNTTDESSSKVSTCQQKARQSVKIYIIIEILKKLCKEKYYTESAKM